MAGNTVNAAARTCVALAAASLLAPVAADELSEALAGLRAHIDGTSLLTAEEITRAEESVTETDGGEE